MPRKIQSQTDEQQDVPTTAQLIREHVAKNSILCDYLARNLINITELAKTLLPQIKAKNQKATIESISVAISRLKFNSQTKNHSEKLQNTLKNAQLNLRTNINLYVLDKGGGADVKEFGSDDVFFINHGMEEVTVVVDAKNKSLLKGKILSEKNNLSIISIKSKDYRDVPGFVFQLLLPISREGINLEDIISTKSQISFVVESKHTMRVFEIIQGLIK
jgi:hypothetical protein